MSEKKLFSLEDLSAFTFPAGADNEPIDNMDNEEEAEDYNLTPAHLQKPRIYLDRKQRKGKAVTLITDLEVEDVYLTDLCKTFKSKCGVGGSVKEGEIILQGDQRKRILAELINLGYKGSKLAGG